MRNYIDINEDQSFTSVDEMNKLLTEKIQKLKNTRYYKSVEIVAVAMNPEV